MRTALEIGVSLGKREVLLLHRIMSAGIIAAPPGVKDGLRRKLSEAKDRLKRLTSEQIDGGNEDRVSTDDLRIDAERNDRASSDTSGEGDESHT